MRFLTKEQLIALHSLLIGETGGIHGLRDEGRLKAALAAPFITFDSLDLYKSDVEKAARLSFELVRGHPFIDGNKRIGVEALLIVLLQNGFSLDADDEEVISTFLLLAEGKIGYFEFLGWVVSHVDVLA